MSQLPIDSTSLKSEYSLDSWTIEEGFPAFSISGIAQSKSGYIWLATNEGVIRFDGIQFTKIKNHSHEDISTDIVKMVQHKDGKLWLCMYDCSLVLFTPDSLGGVFTYHPLPQKEFNSDISNIFFDCKNNMWIVRESKLYFLTSTYSNNSTPQLIDSSKGCYGEIVNSVFEDSSNAIFVSTSMKPVNLFYKQPIGFLNIKRNRDTHFTQVINSISIHSILQTSKNSHMLGSNLGLFVLSSEKIVPYFVKQKNSTFNIKSIIQDSEKKIWFGSEENGLYQIADGTLRRFSLKEGLSSNRVISLFVDRENSIWIGTRGGGLNRLKRKKVSTYTKENGLPENNIASVFEDSKKTLWVGTKTGGISHLVNQKWTTFSTRNGLAGNLVRAIIEDEKHTMWLGTDNGISHYQNNIFHNYNNLNELLNNQIRVLYKSKKNNLLWAGKSTSGFSKFIPKNNPAFINYVAQFNAVNTNTIRGIIENSSGDIWIATRGGLQFLKKDSLQLFTSENGLPNNDIMSLYSDSNNTLWIGTYNGGLSHFKNNTFHNYTTKNGLFDNVIYHILEDDFGNLWFGCNKGIFTIPKKQFDEFDERKIPALTPVSYGISDGMLSVECNGGSQPSCWKGHDGKLYFATMGGVAIVDPKNITKNSLPPPVAIEKIIVNDDTLSFASSHELSAGKKKLEFHYTALSLLAPEKNQFKYKLDGFDENWINAGTRRKAYYTNIPAGEYTFRVIACNNDGVWNEQGASMNITIPSHWWEIIWIQIGAFLLLGFGVYVLFQSRISYIQKAEAHKTEINRQLAELEMKALRAQMNPHFIFNCLNSIQGCILAKETENAYSYLSKFAKLLRMILENSEETFIPLESELNMLKLYLELEALSYEHAFSYSIIIDPHLNMYDMIVPTMIIQPYVENAIWHGLVYKKGERKLTVKIKKQNESLICWVEDTGVGRERANELESVYNTKRKSRGMKITKERMNIIQRITGQETLVNVIDLYDTHKNAAGTRVEIKLPVISA